MEKKVFFKNASRQQEIKEPYVPAYQKAGVMPVAQPAAGQPNSRRSGLVQDGPKPFVVNTKHQPPVPSQQQYVQAQYQNSDILGVAGSIPNVVGNVPKNLYPDPESETFSTVDDIISDDLGNVDVKMHPPINDQQDQEVNTNVVNDQKNELTEILYSMNSDIYLLLLEGVPICSAPLEAMEDEISALIYGTHELCDSVPVNKNSVCVVKKMPIKVGAFLE